MELLDGEPLSARLGRGPMAFDDVVAVMSPLMDVVAAFHQPSSCTATSNRPMSS